jgi:hypothetical protein
MHGPTNVRQIKVFERKVMRKRHCLIKIKKGVGE